MQTSPSGGSSSSRPPQTHTLPTCLHMLPTHSLTHTHTHTCLELFVFLTGSHTGCERVVKQRRRRWHLLDEVPHTLRETETPGRSICLSQGPRCSSAVLAPNQSAATHIPTTSTLSSVLCPLFLLFYSARTAGCDRPSLDGRSEWDQSVRFCSDRLHFFA